MPLAQLIGPLEAAQQIPQGRQHLVGQGIAHHRLEAAALLEHIAQAVAVWIEEHRALAQQQLQPGEHQAAAHFAQLGQGEGEVAGALALRRHHQPQLGAIEQQPRLHSGFTQQPLKTLLAGGPPEVLTAGALLVQGRQ